MTPDFDDDSFWTKVRTFAVAAGREVIEKALWLYYAAQAKGTPVWAKTTIYAALAYFLFPLDAIPDVVPVAGYTDDLGTLAAATATVAMYQRYACRRLCRPADPCGDGRILTNISHGQQ